MKKEILSVILWAQELIDRKEASDKEVERLARWIGYFQHERFVHLITTVFVGLVDMISLIAFLLIPNYYSFTLVAALSVLFVFYILHYYALENGVQKLYKLIDDLTSR
ncbi:MAG: hypothetical protein LBQ52_07605 [Helicobacteraceae bacterium]|nr:hypothetical protein [Helicobacteraceae bacterium]